jgi:hypothetical protein
MIIFVDVKIFMKLFCSVQILLSFRLLSKNFKIRILIKLLHGLWKPVVQFRIHTGSPIIPILSRIKSIPRIDTYLFKVHSNNL